jgi:regulator of cell morphogenesis and NO signaling
VRDQPATIAVFQRHGIEFCCGGHTPIREASVRAGMDLPALLAELREAVDPICDLGDWRAAPVADLVAHIQHRYHDPLYVDLPRLAAMARKVEQRHGSRHPHMLGPLREAVESIERDLVRHIGREDAVLFPDIVASATSAECTPPPTLVDALATMEHEHRRTAEAFQQIRTLTRGYQPPNGACATFRGLFYGLSALEHQMRLHTHLEDDVLFPRALAH